LDYLTACALAYGWRADETELMSASVTEMGQGLLREEKVMNSQGAAIELVQTHSEMSASTDEKVLVAQAKSGSSRAFGELYERHRLLLFRSAFRILRNREDAEDAVQESFQRAFTSLPQFREDSSFSTWVTRIGINAALMLLRQRRLPSLSRMQNDDVNDTLALDIADERATPEEALAEDELRSLVHQAISRLRGTLRSVVLLRELHGLTSAETARCLGLTVSTVKARTFHARRHLRRHLSGVGFTHDAQDPVRPTVASGSQGLTQSTISGWSHG
jgi:RNA polymerase sigma-70 factor, ECF subfamily